MIIILITLIICLIVFICVLFHNKSLLLDIKIKTIEEKINSNLLKRKDLINDSEQIIKELINTDKEIYENINDLNEKNISMFELDRKLIFYINEFNLIFDKYKKLKNNEEFKNIYNQINETNELLKAYKEYYNDTIAKYNKLIKTFPLNIFSFIKRKKVKEYFDIENKNK